MSTANRTELTIIIPVIVGVMLAVLYDGLQEWFRGWFSTRIPLEFVSIDSKAMGGFITMCAGLTLLFIIYRKSLKRSEHRC